MGGNEKVIEQSEGMLCKYCGYCLLTLKKKKDKRNLSVQLYVISFIRYTHIHLPVSVCMSLYFLSECLCLLNVDTLSKRRTCVH